MLDSKVQEEYDDRFSEEDKSLLKNVGISPSIANKYDKCFKADYIKQLFNHRCILPEQIKEYNKRFSRPIEIMRLALARCYPSDAEKYPIMFKGNEIGILFMNGISAEQAGAYNPSYYKNFSGYEISNLVKTGCSPKQALKYLKLGEPKSVLDGNVISVLHLLRITPEIVKSSHYQKKKRLLKFFRRLAYSLPPQFKEKWDNCSLIGTGTYSAVFLKNGSAFKFSMNIQREISLLKKLKNPRNVVSIKNGSKVSFSEDDIFHPAIVEKRKSKFCVELDYLHGDSLENILNQKKYLPINKVLKYASDIMNGLIELRQAGIWYHRDIRPANIMIDQENDRALIIDLGVATKDRHAQNTYNRRYGGANDLVSLGQVMYKMATGDHIFAQSKSMEETVHAQKIRDYRDKVYSDKTGKLLEMHLKQVDKTVQDEQLRTLIKACLTAKNYHYRRIYRLFKKFS